MVAINAKYIHSNLAVYSLYAYASLYKEDLEIAEYTINHYMDDILQDIYKRKPDIICFSCYIWNIDIVEKLTKELNKVLPNADLWLGGPEVSYKIKEKLEQNLYIKGIMFGEGERTFLELIQYYKGKISLNKIKGIAYRVEQAKEIIQNYPRDLMKLDLIPFPYSDLSDFKHKILYYETSRGCPYSCSYCLSSIEKQVRFRNNELVAKELDYFLLHKVPQVKFVDRTFNCNREHALFIWRYIKEHDNGCTNFHFEISADLLQEEELDLLNCLRPGLIQLEIGVQSTNSNTIAAIKRKMDLNKLYYAVERIKQGNNIHQHLDLIAGLPYEDYFSFQQSFNQVYNMRPNQLQLGFLKVLKGSAMYENSKEYSIIYQENPPYEVLFTKWISYDKILILKAVEQMVEVYYNSNQFIASIMYLEHFFKEPFELYYYLAKYYESHQLMKINHTRMQRYSILLEFYREVLKKSDDIFSEILVYDLYLRENIKSRPEFAKDQTIQKEKIRSFYQKDFWKKELKGYEHFSLKQASYLTHLEHFSINMEKTVQQGKPILEENFILFDYQNRNPLTYQANTIVVKIGSW